MKLIGFDTETFFIQHNVAPPLVCLTVFFEESGERVILGRDAAIPYFKALVERVLHSSEEVLVAQNACFDTVVLTAECPALMELISRAYAQRKIVCTKLAEILMNTADPKTAGRARVQRFRKMGEHYASANSGSLDGLVLYYLAEDITAAKKDARRTSYAQLVNIPVEEWSTEDREYAIKDAEYVVQVLRAQLKRAIELSSLLGGAAVLQDLPRQSYVEYLLQMQAMVFGVRIDPERIAEASEELMEEQDSSVAAALELELLAPDQTKYRGYKKSTKRLQVILADIEQLIGIDLERTEKGAIKGGEQELRQIYEAAETALNREFNLATKLPLTTGQLVLLNRYVDGLKAYQACEAAWKAKHTFVDALAQASLNEDNHIRFGYQGLKETGRTSSRDPNMQNLPRGGKTRSCLRPRKGCIFLQADYSNAELRTLGQLHIDEGRTSRLAEEYQKNPQFDPHLFAALEMLRVEGVDLTYAQGKEVLKDKSHQHFKNLKGKRQFAKVANFGYAGGLGAAKFVTYAAGQGLKVTLEEARQLKDAWLQVWTEMREYFEVRGQMTEYVSDLNDRDIEIEARRSSSQVYDSVYTFSRSGRARFLRNYTIACNTGFQGVASDGAKDALILIHEECFFNRSSPLYRSVPALFIHDEVVLSVPFPEDTPENRVKVTAAAMRLKELMEQGMRNHTPDVPAVAEPCLSVAWSKDMESYMRDDGTLSIFGLDK
jgi:DNA polymerase I-like protein with 3'-5' exonuclease and polymerase domains